MLDLLFYVVKSSVHQMTHKHSPVSFQDHRCPFGKTEVFLGRRSVFQHPLSTRVCD